MVMCVQEVAKYNEAHFRYNILIHRTLWY